MKIPSLVLVLYCVLTIAVSSAERRPNILVVLADDFGWGNVSYFGGKVPTPALDRMAKEVTRFTHFPSDRVDMMNVLTALDSFTTRSAQADATLPKGYTSDGEDFSRALRGQSVTRTQPIFWEYGRNTNSFAYPAGTNRSPNLAVRDGNWKLFVNADGTGAELYDLATDANETKNLAAEETDVARRLSISAVAWRKSLP